MTVDNTDWVARAQKSAQTYLAKPNKITPPDYAQEIGDGDYHAIGAEFLELMVQYGGLKPTDAVLDIGCGLGRIAMPLAEYLDDIGQYTGFDISRSSIDWCCQNIAHSDPRFVFVHSDFYHPLYNSRGKLSMLNAPIPLEEQRFDFLVMASVFTHLSKSMIEWYFQEINRLMRSGGRLFATCFLVNAQASNDDFENCRYKFEMSVPGPIFKIKGDGQLTAVALDRQWFIDSAREIAGLDVKTIAPGNWADETIPSAASFQDIVVLTKPMQTAC